MCNENKTNKNGRKVKNTGDFLPSKDINHEKHDGTVNVPQSIASTIPP